MPQGYADVMRMKNDLAIQRAIRVSSKDQHYRPSNVAMNQYVPFNAPKLDLEHRNSKQKIEGSSYFSPLSERNNVISE